MIKKLIIFLALALALPAGAVSGSDMDLDGDVPTYAPWHGPHTPKGRRCIAIATIVGVAVLIWRGVTPYSPVCIEGNLTACGTCPTYPIPPVKIVDPFNEITAYHAVDKTCGRIVDPYKAYKAIPCAPDAVPFQDFLSGLQRNCTQENTGTQKLAKDMTPAEKLRDRIITLQEARKPGVKPREYAARR